MRRALTTWKSKTDKPVKEPKPKVRPRRSSVVISESAFSAVTRSDTSTGLHSNDDTIHIRVGQPDDARVFRLSKRLLSDISLHFSLATSTPIPDPIELPDDDPIAFSLFAKWLESQESHVPYEPLCYSDEPWRSKAAEAWVLAKNLRADAFETYALSQFIKNCVLLDVSTWEMIEREVQEHSTLRRFCNHWIAWSCWLAAPTLTEYAVLRGARLQGVVTDQTRDPRTFDLDHWYSTCGDDINPSCNHDPAARRMKAEAISRMNKTKYADWGRDWETKNDPARSKSTKKI